MAKQHHYKINNLPAYYRIACAVCFILAFAILSACHPYIVKEEKYFFFIHNQTANSISYAIYFRQAWSEPESVSPKDFSHAYDFYAEPPINTLPMPIGKIKLISSQCTVTINRKDFGNFIKKDSTASWDLHVTENVLKILGC